VGFRYLICLAPVENVCKHHVQNSKERDTVSPALLPSSKIVKGVFTLCFASTERWLQVSIAALAVSGRFELRAGESSTVLEENSAELYHEPPSSPLIPSSKRVVGETERLSPFRDQNQVNDAAPPCCPQPAQVAIEANQPNPPEGPGMFQIHRLQLEAKHPDTPGGPGMFQIHGLQLAAKHFGCRHLQGAPVDHLAVFCICLFW